jgi:hypothetical protein
MSSKAGSVLAWYQGWAWRRAVTAARWWPCRAYQVMIRVQVSRANGTVRSTARRGAVAGLAGAQDVAGVGEGLLDGPAGGVAGDQGGRAGGRVGGDQGEQAGVAVAGEDDPDGAGVQAAVPQAGDVGQAHGLVTAVGPDGGRGPAGGSGQLAGGAQPLALAAGPSPGAGGPR